MFATPRRPRVWDFFLWLFGRRRRYRVDGDSMLPTLAPGDHILVDPFAFVSRSPKLGDIVVARHPYIRGKTLVKRVGSFENGRVVLKSDNASEGTDSRSFGALSLDSILGQVVAKLGGS